MLFISLIKCAASNLQTKFSLSARVRNSCGVKSVHYCVVEDQLCWSTTDLLVHLDLLLLYMQSTLTPDFRNGPTPFESFTFMS